MDMQELVNNTIREQLAAQVLAAVGTEARDAILSRSIETALASYSFTSTIEKAVAESASKAAGVLLESPAWKERIDAAVCKGMELLAARLPGAVHETLLEAFFGKEDGSYGTRPGLMLKHMRAK